MRWRNFGEIASDDRHKVYLSGEEDRHEYGTGLVFSVHKDMVGEVG